MMRSNAARHQPACQLRIAFNMWLALSIAQYGNVAQADWRAQPGTGRFGKSFLGSKAFGQKPCRIVAGEKTGVFGRSQNAVSVMLTKTGKPAADAVGIQQIGPHAVNQSDTLTSNPAARILSA